MLCLFVLLLLSGTPSGLWHYEFIAFPPQRLNKNADKLRSCCFQQKNANKLYKNFLVGDWPILCGRDQAFQGPPKTSQHIAARRSLTAKKIFSRTPRCYLRHKWALDAEDSKNGPMVQACERRANREPSLVVSRGHVSWSMLGLIALTRQKQLT
jgi:hypothetical protein